MCLRSKLWIIYSQNAWISWIKPQSPPKKKIRSMKNLIKVNSRVKLKTMAL